MCRAVRHAGVAALRAGVARVDPCFLMGEDATFRGPPQVALMLGVVPRLEWAPEGCDAGVSVTDIKTVMANPEGSEGLDQHPVGPVFGPMERGKVKFWGFGEEAGKTDPIGTAVDWAVYQAYWRGQDPIIRDLQTRLAALERKAALKRD